ncbi:cation efflux protein [Gorgonomyces haynaldii]|nr:cation efflux protein [Gorgonomyces haynaldii]
MDSKLPLFKSTNSYSKYEKSWTRIIQRYLRTIVQNPETRNVFFFLLLNLSFTVVEFLYGWWCNSLGLTADAVHMLFDSTALIFSLIASVYSKRDPNYQYTFGFKRVETLTGFVNALALFFASGNIVWEAIERLYEPQKLKTDSLLLVSVLGLLVNIVGIFAFNHGHAPGEDCGHGHDHGHKNPLMHGMFLHVLSDALGSVGVIVSSLLVQFFGWEWSDPLCSILISLLTFASIWPLLKSSTETLLQRCPRSLDQASYEIISQVNQLPGVLGCANPHLWELDHQSFVATIKVQARREADTTFLLHSIQSIFTRYNVQNVTIQIELDQIHQY